ncbi:dTDP-glucose 4,6-dehydratase [Alphaproteobacteria bacterium]|nr:dTDP-glucose 4,6-dehydratase [Alphaproteobacteria bacterium]
MKRLILTGGAGFIGTSFLKFIKDKTDYEVLIIDSLTYASNYNFIDNLLEDKRFCFENCDVRNEIKISKLINEFAPNIIINMAAESHVDQSIKNPLKFLDTNVFGTLNMLRQSNNFYQNLNVNLKKDFRFYQISTDEVYGDNQRYNKPFDENHPYNPSSPYSASKASADHFVRSWTRTYGLPTLISTCSNNYGPRQNLEKFIPTIVNSILSNTKIPVYGNGLQKRDWIFVEDHVDGIFSVLERGQISYSYNIGSENVMSNLEIIHFIINEMLKPSQKEINDISFYNQFISFIEDRPGHDLKYSLDTSRIREDLKWLPKHSFEDGMMKTITWYKNKFRSAKNAK